MLFVYYLKKKCQLHIEFYSRKYKGKKLFYKLSEMLYDTQMNSNSYFHMVFFCCLLYFYLVIVFETTTCANCKTIKIKILNLFLTQ